MCSEPTESQRGWFGFIGFWRSPLCLLRACSYLQALWKPFEHSFERRGDSWSLKLSPLKLKKVCFECNLLKPSPLNLQRIWFRWSSLKQSPLELQRAWLEGQTCQMISIGMFEDERWALLYITVVENFSMSIPSLPTLAYHPQGRVSSTLFKHQNQRHCQGLLLPCILHPLRLYG